MDSWIQQCNRATGAWSGHGDRRAWDSGRGTAAPARSPRLRPCRMLLPPQFFFAFLLYRNRWRWTHMLGRGAGRGIHGISPPLRHHATRSNTERSIEETKQVRLWENPLAFCVQEACFVSTCRNCADDTYVRAEVACAEKL